MEHSMLPLNYFCRNGRLCMKKAAFSKKAHLFNDELLHLKKFHALVVTTIPSHPLYEEKKTEKQIVELQTFLPDIKRRMQQLELELATSKPKDAAGVLKARRVHPKPLTLPSFSEEPLPASQQKPHRKAKSSVSRKSKKQDKELWPASSNLEPDQASPSASSPASPLREHAFDGSRGKGFGGLNFSNARESLDAGNSYDMDNATDTMASMPPINSVNGLSHRRERSLFNGPNKTAAALDNGRWHGSVNNDHLHKDNVATPLLHRQFDNVMNSTFTSVERHGKSGVYQAHNDISSVSQNHDKNDQTQNAGGWEPSKEGFTGISNSWWNQNGAQSHLYADHNMVKAESMHKEWVFSGNSARKGGDTMTTTSQNNAQGYSGGNTSEKHGKDHRVSDHAGADMKMHARNDKEKDGLAVSIRSKLEEEYEKLREQMRWLKYRDGFLGRDNANKTFAPFNHQSAGERQGSEKWDGMNGGLTYSANGDNGNCDSSLHGNQKNTHDVGDFWMQEHASRSTSFGEKNFSLNSVIDTLPPSPSAYHTSLPFSHYISKLKQLVPDDASPDTSWPVHSLNCQTQIAKPECGMHKTALFDDQTENAIAHSPASSDTFADSLTYSNPVFELEGELELPECDSMSTQLDRALPDERIILEEETLQAGLQGCALFSSQLQGGGTEMSHRYLPSLSKFSKDAESDPTSISLDCPPHLLRPELFKNGDFHSPLKEDESADFTIAGHKFRFAKDFFLKKMQEKLDKIEQVKNLCKEDEGTKDALLKEMYNAGLGSSSCLNKGWTNADSVESQAQSIQGPSVPCSQEGAKIQEGICEETPITSSTPPNPRKEFVDVPWKVLHPQNYTKEASQEAIFEEESKMEHIPQGHQGFDGDVKAQELVDNTGKCKVSMDIEGEWRLHAKIHQLEQDLKECKDSSTRERDFIKNYIDNDIRTKLDELVSTLEWTQHLLVEKEHEKERFEHGLHVKVEQCEGKVKLMQEQVDFLIEEIKSNLIKEMRGNTSLDLEDVKDVCKGQLEVMEKEMAKNVDSLRCELNSSLDSMQRRTDARIKMDRDALESLVVQRIDVTHALPSADNNAAIADLKSELCRIWDEIRQLSKGKEEIKEQVGKLTKVAGETKESLNRKQSVILSESDALKKQLRSLKKQSSKSKNERKEIRREIQGVVESFQVALTKMTEDENSVKKEAESLKRLEESLKNDKVSMENLFHEKTRQAEAAVKEDVEIVKSIREELLREKANCSFAEKDLVMERLDQLSHYYLGALEEVKEDLLAVKLIGQGRLEDMEYRWEDFMRRQHQSTLTRGNSLHDLVMDSLESRISHLEHILDTTQNLQRAQFKVDSILAITEKDQECASAAAAKAMASAHKADEILASILGSFGTELENTRNNSLKLQESLQLEREAAAMACSEIKALSADLVQEKNLAVSASSEAKRRSFEIWEGLQNDMMNLRNTLCLIDKDKEVASAAANEAMAAASRAEELLEGIAKAYEEIAALQAEREEASECQAKKDMNILQEQEEKWCELLEMRERMQDLMGAIARVAKNTSQLDEEHRKQEMCLHDLSKQIVATSAEQQGILERVSDVSKKVQKLDHTLVNLALTVERVHTNTKDLEKATTNHEAAEGAAVAELEKRICHLENPFQRDHVFENTDQPCEKQPIGFMEKQHLLSLYKEMSSFFKKLQKIEGQEEDIPEADKQLQIALTTLDNRVMALENRVHQVESGLKLATRALDTRMEIFSSQLQTAIEAAMTAEGKCSALGSELVKVFRTLASSKKESPPKLMECQESSEPHTHRHPKAEVVSGSKTKCPPNAIQHAACALCKKGGSKGSSVTTESSAKELPELDTKPNDTRDSAPHARTPEGSNSIESHHVSQCEAKETDTRSTSANTMHVNSSLGHASTAIGVASTSSASHSSASYAHANASSIESYKGSATAARMLIHGNDGAIIKMGRKFSLTAHGHNSQDRVSEVCEASNTDPSGGKALDIVRRHDAGMVILEGKLPITQGKLGKRRIECTKKSIHLSSTARDYEMTDIRLNAGRIFVNVSHRSAFISRTRLVKRGDTLTVKSEA